MGLNYLCLHPDLQVSRHIEDSQEIYRLHSAIFPLTTSVGIHGALLRKWREGAHPSTADGSGGEMLTEDL